MTMSDSLPAVALCDAADAVVVSIHNARVCARGLPFLTRKAIEHLAAIREGELLVRLPDGRRLRFSGDLPGPNARMTITRWRFARRLAIHGDIGVAESFIDGDWDSPDLSAFIEFFCRNDRYITAMFESRSMFSVVRLAQRLRHTLLRRNTKRGARRNIHAHYDLGNAFYQAWLDRTMTYSSAIFDPSDSDLASAQTRKYRLLAEATGISREHHVLEIGCGWGGFAEYAASQIGCRVTALTISQEQFEFASRRMAERGLSDRVTIRMQDYRDERGQYDRIASIEMFEAVGEAYWPTYFRTLRERLKPGGRAGLQIITIDDAAFESYRRNMDFIRHYIFPGGMLPSLGALRGLGDRFGVPLADERAFAPDYARTLADWHQRFHAAWPRLAALGFDERFRKMWSYYLSYCEGGFRSGLIDVRQMVFARQS